MLLGTYLRNKSMKTKSKSELRFSHKLIFSPSLDFKISNNFANNCNIGVVFGKSISPVMGYRRSIKNKFTISWCSDKINKLYKESFNFSRSGQGGGG